MQFVDFDETAARAAAAACSEAAAVLDSAAARLTEAASGALGEWSGASKIAFADNAADIAANLRTEASSLDATAEAIRRAIGQAQAEDDRRRQEHLERLREAREAAAAGGGL